LSRDVHVKTDTEFAAAATYWRSRYGFRVHTAFSRSTLQVSDAVVVGAASPAASASDINSVGIDTWLYDIGGAIGFVEYSPGRSVWPYGFVGVGGITYNLKQTIPPPLTFVGQAPSQPAVGRNTTVIVGDGRQFLLTTNALSQETVFEVNVGM